MEADDVKSEYKVQSAARRNDYAHQFSEMRRPFSDEEYHTFAKAVNQRIRNNPDQDHFVVPVTYYGDDTKVVLVRRTGDEQFEAYDLYKLNTEMYTGRIVDLLNTLEGVVNEYGSEKFAEWLRSPAYDVFQTFFSRYDRQSDEFPEFYDYDGTRGEASNAIKGFGQQHQRGGLPEGTGEVRSPDGVEVDEANGSAYKTQSSARTWYESDYVAKR